MLKEAHQLLKTTPGIRFVGNIEPRDVPGGEVDVVVCDGFTGTEVAVLAVGCVVAFGMSLAAIRFLMDYVKRHDFKFFGAYRIVLGIIVLAVAAATAIF